MIKTNLWIYDPVSRQFHKNEISAEKPVKMSKSGDYCWLIFQNPYPAPGREWIMAEKGTGYILAHGSTGPDAYSNGYARFRTENPNHIKLSDIRQLINYQLNLLKRSIPEPDYNEIKPDLTGFQIIEKPKEQRFYAKSE